MEKLGVDVEPTASKEAEARKTKPGGQCPRCDALLLPWADSNVPRCPQCGTAPFEVE